MSYGQWQLQSCRKLLAHTRGRVIGVQEEEARQSGERRRSAGIGAHAALYHCTRYCWLFNALAAYFGKTHSTPAANKRFAYCQREGGRESAGAGSGATDMGNALSTTPSIHMLPAVFAFCYNLNSFSI